MTLTQYVEGILEKDRKARDSDSYLYLEVCRQYNPIALNLSFDEVMRNLKTYGYPSIETVGRIRRKLQEEQPELRASQQVQDWRAIKEEQARAGIFI